MRRPLVLVALAAGVAVLVATAVTRDGGSTRLSDTTAVTGRATTSGPPPSAAGARGDEATTAAVPDGSHSSAEAVGSQTYVYGEEPMPGLVITNSGSATANVGGNVVVGGPAGGGPGGGGMVVTGDATAVGNSSSVRAP